MKYTVFLNISNLFLFCVFIINTGFGLFVFLKKIPQKRIRISFSFFSWALALWNFSVLMIYLFNDPWWRLFWVRMSFAATSIAPFAFLTFSLLFPKDKWIISNRKLLFISIPSIIFVFFSFTKLMVHSVEWNTLTSNYGP